MPLLVNLWLLEEDSIRLQGELPVAELDLDPHDEVIRIGPPLVYDLEVERFETGLLAQGSLTLPLDCECVRCLKPFQYIVKLDPWRCHLPLEGEEAVPIINDCADLTPTVREDILLEFPQHPLCEPECRGLPNTLLGNLNQSASTAESEAGSPAWAELNKLKLKR
jgi:uncharacterized protein